MYSLKEKLLENNATEYPNILVTGAPRSGTNLVSRIIERDLGYRFIDELEFGVDRSKKRFLDIVNKNHNCVIQCAGLSGLAMQIRDQFVVVVFRNIKDIKESMDRVDWDSFGFGSEKVKWSEIFNINSNLHPLYFPYMYWTLLKLTFEANKTEKNYLEVQYKNLKDDPMFVEKPLRKNWTTRQTSN
jgi:hypothetical protein